MKTLFMKTISEWVKEAHENALVHGWWLDISNPNVLEKISLIHSELSEAVEAVRNCQPPIFQNLSNHYDISAITPECDEWSDESKPEGVVVELADAVIRIFDLCGAMKWDLEKALELKHKYNKTRPYRHGGKRY